MYRQYIKRLLDLLLSFFAVIILSPIFIIIAFLVKFKLGSPILFMQDRPGLHGKIFTLYKFRTMTDRLSDDGKLLPDKDRLTRFGQLLRSLSLDELPELFNILKGDMSIVGPRPLLVQYLRFYNDEQKRRHEVRPGLTGMAQVNGRNAISWEEKFNYDIAYVNNINFIVDMKIIFLTFRMVYKREGINSETAATMEPFDGNSKESADNKG